MFAMNYVHVSFFLVSLMLCRDNNKSILKQMPIGMSSTRASLSGFYWLLFVYIMCFLILIFMYTNYNETSKRTLTNCDKELGRLNKSDLDFKPNIVNKTKYVFINRTEVVTRTVMISKYGPGENGAAVSLPRDYFTSEEMETIKINKKQFGFNTFISDLISLQRRTPDRRMEACKHIKYPTNLPQVSVVIIFRDEWWSIVLRTAYSVLINSPPELIREVILVDDGSVNMNLRRKVALHVNSEPKFRLVRNESPLGLMMARQKGIEATRSKYFIVMDGHMETTPGWLEPLLARLLEEPNACLCSEIGEILPDNFHVFLSDPNKVLVSDQFPFFDPMTLSQMWALYSGDYVNKQRQNRTAPRDFGLLQVTLYKITE